MPEDIQETFGKAKSKGISGSSAFASSFIVFPIVVPSLVGAVLIFNSFRGFAKYYEKKKMSRYAPGIFPYAIGHILSMVGFILGLIAIIGFHDPVSWLLLILRLSPTLIVICFLLSLIGVIFLRKSFSILSEISGARAFRIVGLLLLIDMTVKLITIGLVWCFPSSPIEIHANVTYSLSGLVSVIAWILAGITFGKLKP